MPNDCRNSFTITNITHDQWRALAATFQVRDEEYQQNFLKTYYPEPDYTVTPVAMTDPEISARFAKTEEERQEILKNEPTIREDAWWDWRVQNWGTKWDAYQSCSDAESKEPSDKFRSSFCTAFSPLSEKCMAVISEKFPGSLLINSYEEDGMDFFGVTVAKDGLVRDFTDSLSEHRESFARQQVPDLVARLEEAGQDLNEYLHEFLLSDYESAKKFNDYIFGIQESSKKKMVREIEAATSNPLKSA
jgi:hypothetical protein